MSSAKSANVRPGDAVDAPSPGRSTEISRTPSVLTASGPKPSRLLVAAPGHSSTGVPSAEPHSAHPRRRPSGRRVSLTEPGRILDVRRHGSGLSTLATPPVSRAVHSAPSGPTVMP